MADLSYPFRKAAWRTARVIIPQSETGFKIRLGALGTAVAAAVIGISNVSPDATVIDGQNSRITSYEQQIDQLSGFYANTVEKTREAWRSSSIDGKDVAQADMDAAHMQFQNTAAQVLAGIYTENGISEDAAADLLEQFENKVGEISSIEIDGKKFADIGDAAFLHEAQAKHVYKGTELDRAMEIAKTAADKNENELMLKGMSPIIGVMGALVSILMLLLADGLTGGGVDRLEKYARKPAPKPKKKSGFNH